MADGASVITEVPGTIESQLDKALWLESFTAVERLSEPFRISCEVTSGSRLDLGGKLGTGVSLNVAGSSIDVKMSRAFHGLLMEASEIEEFDGAFRYHLVLRPWLTKLQLIKGSRIFQHASVKDIVESIFKTDHVTSSSWLWKCQSRGTLVREYCVQYNETDFDFVSRLLEEEGIYYFFAHTRNDHVMVICDGPGCHAPFVPGPVSLNDQNAAGPHLWSLTEHVKPTITMTGSRDAHFMHFGDTYESSKRNAAPSKDIVGTTYTYPGTHAYLTDDGGTKGDDYNQLRLEAGQAEQKRYLAEGNAFATSVGSILEITPAVGSHVSSKDTVKIMVTGAVHAFSGQEAFATRGNEGLVMRVSLEGVPSDHVWRPMLRTPKPVARGPQVATVAGPADDPVHVDTWGRVLVVFPWDLHGKADGTAPDPRNQSSCWLRVATSWAGNMLGEVFFPRVGTEVIVDFLDGDMDRPFVSSAAYDSSNKLPLFFIDADGVKKPVDGKSAKQTFPKTLSGWVTETIYGNTGDNYPNAVDPPQGGEKGYNMILFDDMSGSESVTVRAQRDMVVQVRRDETRTISQDRTETVGHDLKLEVQTGDETRTVTKGKRTTTIQQNESLEVKAGNLITQVDQGDETHTVQTGKRTTSIKMTDKLTVTDGDRITEVQQGKQSTTISMGDMTTEVNMGNISTTADLGNVSLKASTGKIEYEALQSIELKVGGNSVKIDQTGVTINGILVQVTAQAMGKVDGGGMLTVKGGVVMIN